MTRPLRIEYPDAVYHITSRGNARQNIYNDDEDREKFLSILSLVTERFHWICHSYCLMDNHYHLLVETPIPNLSAGMRQLNGIYTQAFNRHHQRVGHLFQGRFKAIVVEKQAHLLELSRYIILNPVKAGMVQHPEDYLWSSYRAATGQTKVPDFLTVTWLLDNFSPQTARAQQLYREFVNKEEEHSPWKNLTGQIFLGSDTFIQEINNQAAAPISPSETALADRYAGRPALTNLFEPHSEWTKDERNKVITQAHIEYGYKLKQIAEVLGIHYSTVSKVIKITKNCLFKT